MLAAVYLLWMYQRVFHGEITHEKNRLVPDLNDREKVVLVSLVFVILWMGVYPQTFLRRLDVSTAQVIQSVERGPEYFAADPEEGR